MTMPGYCPSMGLAHSSSHLPFSALTNASNKKFEFDITAADQHNPHTFVSCFPPFDAEKR